MKTKLRNSIFPSLMAIMLLVSVTTSAQDTIIGPNLLSNADFEFVEDLVTNAYGNVWVWPDDWVLVSDSLIWNQYPIFKIWWLDDGTAAIGCWTGVESWGTMYQDLTGLENGLYEFTYTAGVSGAGDSKYYSFLMNYGGDSISHLMPITNEFAPDFIGPVEVTNGSCRVGFHITNGTAGDWADLIALDFHKVTIVGIESSLASKITAFAQNGMLKVDFSGGEINRVDIYTVTGQLISSTKGMKTNSYTSDLRSKGLLFVKIGTDKGTFTKKLVNQ